MWTKRKLFKFSLITIILILLLMELVFRIVFAVEYKGYHTSVYVQGNTLQMRDSVLIFRNRPFYLDYYKRYQFNEEGMRSEPGDVFMPEKKPGDFWVFLFGGSAMEGVGSNKDGEWLDITGVIDYRPKETIAGKLQEILQKEMPSKKVRVFNAANSGYTLLQSRLRYQQLAKKYQMDWVISMDGENEPAVLLQGETPQSFIEKRWNESPLFNFPLNTIIAITSHSACATKLKQWAFGYRFSARLKKNERDSFPARKNWGNKPLGKLKFAMNDSANMPAVLAFMTELKQFDSLLTAKKQPHLLYIQPHLIFRDTSAMNLTERALYNYYTATYNDSLNNSFKRKLLTQYREYFFSPNVQLMLIHNLPEQVFIDYCHFTAQANLIIAAFIATDILKGEAEK
jgi:hypothetical protein